MISFTSDRADRSRYPSTRHVVSRSLQHRATSLIVSLSVNRCQRPSWIRSDLPRIGARSAVRNIVGQAQQRQFTPSYGANLACVPRVRDAYRPNGLEMRFTRGHTMHNTHPGIGISVDQSLLGTFTRPDSVQRDGWVSGLFIVRFASGQNLTLGARVGVMRRRCEIFDFALSGCQRA
jgi:hypothetical protein